MCSSNITHNNQEVVVTQVSVRGWMEVKCDCSNDGDSVLSAISSPQKDTLRDLDCGVSQACTDGRKESGGFWGARG